MSEVFQGSVVPVQDVLSQSTRSRECHVTILAHVVMYMGPVDKVMRH